MRLGQLARKLEVHPGRLMEVLSELKIETEKGLNTNLDDDQVELIEQKILEPEPPASSVEQYVEPEQEEENHEEDVIASDESDDDKIDEPEPEEEVELIKAPKVQLPGLKVVGKIDLPESQKEEEPSQEEIEREREETENRERKSFKGDQRRKKGKKEVSYAERRKKEERQHRREQEIRALEEKKRKETYYKENVQSKIKTSAQPTRPRKKAAEEYQSFQQKGPAPKSIFGKFWRWLNT